jgi:hypothetical protein
VKEASALKFKPWKTSIFHLLASIFSRNAQTGYHPGRGKLRATFIPTSLTPYLYRLLERTSLTTSKQITWKVYDTLVNSFEKIILYG